MELLKLPYDRGGLQLVNLRLKNASLKIANLFSTDIFCTNQINSIYNTALGEQIWECAIDKEQFSQLTGIVLQNQYWEEVVNHWFDMTWKKVHS